MTGKEKRILEVFKFAVPKMTDEEKNRLILCGELIGLIIDKRQSINPDQNRQKGA